MFDKNFILYCLFTVHSTHFKSWLLCNASFWFSMLLLCVHIEKPQSTKYKNLTSGTDVVCTGTLGSWKPENIYQFNYTKYYISPSTKRFKIFSLDILPTTTHNHSSWRNVIHPKSSFIWNIHHQGISSKFLQRLPLACVFPIPSSAAPILQLILLVYLIPLYTSVSFRALRMSITID